MPGARRETLSDQGPEPFSAHAAQPAPAPSAPRQPEAQPEAPPPTVAACSRCGAAIPATQPRCDSCALVLGQQVRDRLDQLPGVHKLPVPALEIYLARDFLSQEECDALIAMIDADRVPSGLLAKDPDPNFRTSESCNLRRANPVVQAIETKITSMTGIDPPLGETIQGQRYDVAQRFKPHHDYFFTDQPYWEQENANGGQRTWTAMIFLNEPGAGGQTFFPRVGVRVTPRRGSLMIWNNLDPDGNPNPNSLHEGCPVEDGLKYVITKWYRERPWGVSGAPPAGHYHR